MGPTINSIHAAKVHMQKENIEAAEKRAVQSMTTLASTNNSCQSANALTKYDFNDRRRHNQSSNILSSGFGQPQLFNQSSTGDIPEQTKDKKIRLQSAKPQSRGIVMSEAHNYVSKNSSHFYNSKKRVIN